MDPLQSVLSKGQCTQEGRSCRQRVDAGEDIVAEAWGSQFLSAEAPSDSLPRLEDRNGQPCLSQFQGGCQPVWTRPDDHRIVGSKAPPPGQIHLPKARASRRNGHINR